MCTTGKKYCDFCTEKILPHKSTELLGKSQWEHRLQWCCQCSTLVFPKRFWQGPSQKVSGEGKDSMLTGMFPVASANIRQGLGGGTRNTLGAARDAFRREEVTRDRVFIGDHPALTTSRPLLLSIPVSIHMSLSFLLGEVFPLSWWVFPMLPLLTSLPPQRSLTAHVPHAVPLPEGLSPLCRWGDHPSHCLQVTQAPSVTSGVSEILQ